MRSDDGAGQPILLFGPRGMGKTTLLEEFENDPVHGADVRYIVPSTALTDLDNIPRALLSDRKIWKDWRELVKALKAPAPSNASVHIPGFAELEYNLI